MRDTRWTFLAFAVGKALTLLTTAILARMLNPEDFGAMALVLAITGVILVFSDLGVGATLVTRQELTSSELGAIVAVFLIMGPVLGALSLVVGMATVLLGPDRLGYLLMASGGMLAVSGAGWFFSAYVRRVQRFRLLLVVQVSQALLVLMTSVSLAALGLNVWALLLGQVSGMVGLTILYRWRLGPIAKPVWDLREARRAIGHGRGFLAQGGIGYLAQNVDNFAVGTILGSRSLGFYSMAYKVAEIPYQGIGNPVYQVMFPQLAASRHRGENTEPVLSRGLVMIMLVASPLAALMITQPKAVLEVLYGPSWASAASTLAILGVWGLIRPFQGAIAWYLNGTGHPGPMARVAAWTLAVSVPTIVLAAILGGIEWVAAMMALDMAISCAILLRLARKLTGISVAKVVSVGGRPAIGAVGAALVAVPLTDGVSSPLVHLVAASAAMGAIYGVVALAWVPESRVYLRRIVTATLPSGAGGRA